MELAYSTVKITRAIFISVAAGVNRIDGKVISYSDLFHPKWRARLYPGGPFCLGSRGVIPAGTVLCIQMYKCLKVSLIK